MYLIQFRLQFFYYYSLLIQEIVIIKATRLQALGGGQSRPSPPLENKKMFFGYIGGLFATFSSNGGIFSTFSHFWGPFHHVGAFLLLLLHGGGLFWACPPPPTRIAAGAHDCKEGSRAFSPEIFWCDRNLVSSGYVLLRFRLKNDKYNDKL